MQKNSGSGKSTEDCLQLLIKELRHLQHGLDTDLRTDKFLHNKLINACQDLPACQYACFRPSDSLAGLINDLRSSITTWEKSNTGETSQFFTDRRYHHSNRFHHSQRPSRSFRNNRSGNKDQKKKRCFVCDKEGCWSSNHSKEEREESRKKFRAKFNQRFDKYTRQYIADYEGTEDSTDDLDSIDEAIEALIVTDADADAEQTDFEPAEHFVTSFGALESQRAFGYYV
jgi:hypothetical protein